MKKLNVLIAVFSIFIFSISLTQAQKVVGSGPVVSENVNMKAINKVSLGISGDVFITQGNTQSIEIKGQQNIIDLIEKEVKGTSWNIKFPNNTSVRTNEKVEIFITMKDLKGLNVGGSGSIYGQNTFKNLDDVDLNVGGSGSIELSLEAEDVDANIGGSGNISLDGYAEDLDANIGGSGSVEAINFKVKEANINAAGSGSVEIHVSNELSAIIAGSGDVKYKGNPRIDKKIVGSGSVKSY
ncbi:head GIN domain-containing protein [Portibacter lacus]|uniref:DUF2807 domain-containing protein n=1 Tax=Portibacter lacus TaxID=1099794 RepID=A0AA37SVZ7_9BACT|nr:head GIN domain-containing protein [Portibacter lacus]GLR19023.1 DUF2807 domain-containing protein [Portibacter lacus]